ncbi:MAG: transcriptional activator RfaH [Gammaproteobacteria bacterium]
MRAWFVVHTLPLKENLAEAQLQAQNFEVFFPRYAKKRRHARKIDTVVVPLFPRYLFVSFDPEVDQWRSINGTLGVSCLLTRDYIPLKVPTPLIEQLQAESGHNQGLISLDHLQLFAPGDKVKILDGSFQGQVAVFEKMTDQDRVQILLHFLGRESRFVLPVTSLEAW